ncbi:5336_t:CDS:2 [Scutellospora calospora]|uniref:5336_t:CDS:1 n=1 Tax=Scutellospora calospora TaxID=85575 RepID=A0ACA9LWS4_9GLOM|nr:5336_t:CDS:2 [Scutellospora calospora]
MKSICESTMDSTTQSLRQNPVREDHSNNNFPTIVLSFLVPNINRLSNRYTGDITLQSNLSQRDHTAQKSQMEDLHSTYIRRQLKDKEFSDRAAELYISLYDLKASKIVSAYMSAISEVHKPVEEKAISTYPIIVKVMKGLYNLRSSKQKPTNIIDVLPTIDYIQSLGSNSEMPILNLT